MNYHMTRISSNAKTGPIPVTTSHKGTCPASCPLKANGCYADNYHLNNHWEKVTKGERGTDWAGLCDQVKALPKGQLWRHNQAGDLPSKGNLIDREALTQLVKANKGKQGFTYTHHDPFIQGNQWAIQGANLKGFSVNVSTEQPWQAALLVKVHKLPAVTLLPLDAPKTQMVEGVQVVKCPAQSSDKVTCASCGLCAIADRDYVIGFEVHGTGKKKAAKLIDIQEV